MTSTLHLGCGQNIKDNAHNVDKLDLTGVDETVDLSSYPWPWEDNSWSHIIAEHVFEHLPDMEETLRQCSRILKPGGILEVTMPVGQNVVADPDHEHQWIWDTPEYYCGKRHWDTDVGLRVVDRSVSINTHLSGVPDGFYTGGIRLYKLIYGQGRWLFDLPVTSGNFEVIFENDSE
jgi:predicted SAM-dependent methyltransferase